MPPRVRGKGKGPMRGGPSAHAGPSNRFLVQIPVTIGLQAVSPPPLPIEEPPQQPPQPPPEPPRRRRNTRISVRGGPRFSSPKGSSSYPPIPEDPQMGGPSHAVPGNDPPPVSYAPPPVGFDNPIPTYPGSSGYNPSGYPTNYGTHDPYLTAAQYNALYPSSYPPVYPTGYPVQGYQYPRYQQPPPPQQEQTQEILQRLDRVEREADDTKKKHNSFLKGLASLIKEHESWLALMKQTVIPWKKNNNTRINITGAELHAMITAEVAQAVDDKFKEPSNVRSKTHSKSHSHSHTLKKDESQHSSNQRSEPQKQIVLEPTSRYTKGCTYKYFVSCKPSDFTGEKGAIDCMKWLDEMETVIDINGCVKEDIVKFVSQSFKGDALT
ncbi:T-cell leukemia homeobox protein 3-like [Helianthus annuus]|uniref:T-cell leukemia homeobox protein 3-like n=1 Tax=Helianthus annuus TaxID=4232 RepID=UPI000B9004B8|nr:T-cell leukemia homeobox protein 3-like [Helianthus annuus]